MCYDKGMSSNNHPSNIPLLLHGTGKPAVREWEDCTGASSSCHARLQQLVAPP